MRGPSIVAHGGVAAVVAVMTTLAVSGHIGQPNRPERFDAKRYVVMPAGDEFPDGIRIHQTIDQDFGAAADRHGFQLNIDNNAGVVTDVEASSETAPDDLDVLDTGSTTRIRVGSPNETVSGRHRYELTYVQPAASVADGTLELDVILTGEALETGRFEVIVNGFELEDTTCQYGRSGAANTCELTVADDGTLRTVIEPLVERAGIRIGGRIVATSDPVELDPAPEPDVAGTTPAAPFVAGGGVLTAVGTYLGIRRKGRNAVRAGGAADAAYGDGPPPVSTSVPPPPGTEFPPPQPSPTAAAVDGPVRMVTDAELGAMATIEFVPPKGIAPWEGALLLAEDVDKRTIGAWFSSMVGAEHLAVSEEGKRVIFTRGPRFDDADGDDREVLDKLFDGGDELRLSAGRNENLYAAVKALGTRQNRQLHRSGWWRSNPNGWSGGTANVSKAGLGVVWFGLAFFVLAMVGGNPQRSFLPSWPLATLVTIVLAAIASFLAYRKLLPSRSVTGSALALRTESFRRFLEASEGKHVQWAWENGLIREYSAWAVALGTADAWQRAIDAVDLSGPIDTTPMIVTSSVMVHSLANSSHARTSSGSGGGGGGFGGFSSGGLSGGSIGGGGGFGGSSSGSW